MLYLRALGSLQLTRDGAAIDGVVSQRRMLALLSILAVAGETGMGRERIIALLWPDGDSERGRSSLSQAMYSARKTLACDTLFVTDGDHVRLNPRAIGSDVHDFDLAVSARDHERVAGLWTGPFLDDFHLPANAPFEQWCSAQRRTIDEEAKRALDVLASVAEEESDWPRAAEWRQRQVAIDPLASGPTLRLAEALTRLEERVAAVRQLRLHATLVRSDLEIEPDESIAAMLETLGQFPSVESTIGTTPKPLIEVQPAGSSTTPPARFRMRWGRVALAASVVAAAASVVGWLTIGQRQPRFDQQVVVAPFRVVGASPSLGFLREGLVELISTRLEDDPQAVDPGALLRAWRNSKILDAGEVARSEVLNIANRFRARAVILGQVVGNPTHLVVTASFIDAQSGAVLATAASQGPLDSLTAMVDGLAGRLLVERAGEGDRFTERMTPSLGALRAYLAGQAAYHRGELAASMREYESALRADTGFALAALHLALAADRTNAWEQHERALAVAWTNRAELSERDRLHLMAFTGPRYPLPSTEREQLQAWEAALAASPDRIDILVELADRFVRSGRLVGLQDADDRARAVINHVLSLDPDNAQARGLQALLTTTPAVIAQDDRSRIPMHWRVAVATNNSPVLRGIRDRMPEFDDETLIAIGRMSQFDGAGAADAERALQIRAARVTRARERLDATLALHSLALNQGKQREALEYAQTLEETQPGSHAHQRLLILDALYGGGDSAAALLAAAELERFANAPAAAAESIRARQLADACVVGQWRMARGDAAGIPSIVKLLRKSGVPRVVVAISANPHTCADLLEAWAAVVHRAPDALEKVAAVDSLVLGGPAGGDAGAYAHIIIARLYETLGLPDRALSAVKRRAYMYGWPRYLATARREESRLSMLTSLDATEVRGAEASTPPKQ